MLAKAKQQLIECEICNCQIEGGNSNLARQKKKQVSISAYQQYKQKEEQQ